MDTRDSYNPTLVRKMFEKISYIIIKYSNIEDVPLKYEKLSADNFTINKCFLLFWPIVIMIISYNLILKSRL